MKTLTLNGKTYSIRKIPCIPAKELLDSGGLDKGLAPLRLWVEVAGLPLTDEVITAHISDWEVLTVLELEAYEYNYGFLRKWKAVTVPGEMAARYRVAESSNVDSIVSALTGNALATYIELRDNYSLEEAFKLLDVLTIKRINEFRAHEEAARK